MPDDLQLQIPLIRQMLEAMRIPVLGLAGFEADDLIATLATAGAERGIDVFICSSDKDCRQLSERPRQDLQPAQADRVRRRGRC